MLIGLIPPHVLRDTRGVISQIEKTLCAHNLTHQPFANCPEEVLSHDQIASLARAMPLAPIAAGHFGREYRYVEFAIAQDGSDEARLSHFLEDALCSIIIGTAHLAIWEGGMIKQQGSSSGSPSLRLKQLLIVPRDDAGRNAVMDCFPQYAKPEPA